MLRKQAWFVEKDQPVEVLEMILIERPIGADRETNAVERKRILLANGRQIAMRRAARAHVVLCMNFEEANVRLRVDNGAVMLGLQPDASPRRNAVSRAR